MTDTYFHSTTTLSLFLSKRNSIHIYKTFPAGKNISYLLDSDGIWAKLSWKKSLKEEVVHCYQFLNNTSLFICQFQNENWVVLTRIFCILHSGRCWELYYINRKHSAHKVFKLHSSQILQQSDSLHFSQLNSRRARRKTTNCSSSIVSIYFIGNSTQALEPKRRPSPMEWVVSCVVRNAGWILLLLLVQTLMVAEARTRDYVRPRYTFIPWSMEFGSRGAQSTATTIMAKRPSRWTQLKIQTIRTDERRRKKSDSERRLLLLLLRALLAAAGCRWWQLHIITVPLILRTNKRQKLRHQNGFGLGFLKHLLYFSRRHMFHLFAIFSQIVCLFIVSNWESWSKQASRDSEIILRCSELRLLAELLDKQFGMFWNAHYKTSYRYVFFSKIYIFVKANYSFFLIVWELDTRRCF